MRPHLFLALALPLALSALPASALATSPAAPAQVSQAGAPPTSSNVDEGVREDASLDHGFLAPTALTQPAHSLVVNDYELAILGVSYAATDRLQLSATVAPSPFGALVFGNAKWQALRTERLRLALQGGIGTSGFHMGAVTSVCLTAGCHSLVSAGVVFVPMLTVNDGAPFIYSGSLIQRLGEEVKLVLEVSSGGLLRSSGSGFAHFHGAVASGGLRFFGRRFSFCSGRPETDPPRRPETDPPRRGPV
jgi:hypothetical protein